MPKKQKSGLYRTKIKIGVGADGKAINKWISGRTKAELEQARQDVIARYITGEALKDDVLFGPYAQKWFEGLKGSGLSAGSLESYRTALNLDILPVLGDINLRAIMPSDLSVLLGKYAGRSKTKITYIKAALNKIFTAACIDGILAKNPMEFVRAPQAAESAEKRALTETERAAIVRVCQTHPHGAYLAVMYYLGLRPGEARGLQWGDFSAGLATVKIQRDIDYKRGGIVDSLKTRQSYRTIPVPAELRKILDPLRGMPSMFLFRGEKSGKPLSKSTAERIWTDLMVHAGIAEPADPNNCYAPSDIRYKWKGLITPHVMRHNFVTMCWENGIDVYLTMRLVGHKSIKTTMDIYTHLTDAQTQVAAQKMDEMFREKSCNKVAQTIEGCIGNQK